MDGDKVTGRVCESGNSYDTFIAIGRGTIQRSRCTCATHATNEDHCKHVAALSIFVVERGSLLRAGIGSADDGIAEQAIKSKDEVKLIPLRAEPVALVRAQFEHKVFKTLTVEPALRYRLPKDKQPKVTTLNFVRRGFETGTWIESDTYLLKIDSIQHELPVVRVIESNKVSFHGHEGLDNLARLTCLENKDHIVFDKTADVTLDPNPLQLISLNIGARIGKHRVLSYEFKNNSITLTSRDLAELAIHGRLCNRFVWKGDKLYQLETPLALLSKYANRSGIAITEDEEAERKLNGYDELYDDIEHPLHPLTAYRLMLELGVKNFTVDAEWKEFHEWRKNFEKKRIPELPKTDYGFDLRDYQKNGLSWIWSLHHRGLAALLADDMGLGKTHQALAFLSSMYRAKRKKPDAPSLVIAPTSVVAAWTQKLRKYKTGLNYHVFHGKGRVLPAKGTDIVLTTYGILQREVILREKEWHVILLDEAQAIKNSGTISSRASRVLKSKFKVAMTGTPLENQATDLWSLMEFLIPGYLGSITRFKRLYGSGHDGTSAHQAQALKRLLSPFLLRRTKSQVLKELPEKTEEVITCEMTPQQERAYNNWLNSSDAEKARKTLKTGEKIDYAHILALLTRLKQVCDHPKLPGLSSSKRNKILNPFDSGKWEAFNELLQEALGSNLKVVVFTQYLGMMDMIGAHLKASNVGYTELRGDTPDRSSRLDKFANEPDCKVFVCSLLAGGLGIDLTSASVCVHLDRWWNPARENQATDRLHRIGQTRGVQVFKLQIPGTVEDRIAAIIESKRNLSGALIEESPLGLKAFSRQELLALLSPISS